jgi:hypothetical protein
MPSNPYTPEENREAQDNFRRKAKELDMSSFSLGFVPNSIKKRYWALKKRKQMTNAELVDFLLKKAGA